MVRPIQQTITCPSCGQPFSAILEQIIDIGVDPTAKERLLSGRVNTISCPGCGYQGAVGTPMMYHDPAKQLAITFVPMELSLDKTSREKLIGDMTTAVMRSLPEDAPRGYLLQPVTTLTMQGLIEQVLEADGITREMIDNERKKVTLIEQISKATASEAEQIIEENIHLVDIPFLELLSAAAQSFGQGGDNRTSLRLLNIRSHLMETTEAGQELKQQQDALLEASKDLQAMGEDISREKFADLFIRSAGNPVKIHALATLGRGLLDYSTLQLISEAVDGMEEGEAKTQLIEAREIALNVAAEYERQSRAVVEQAVATLKMLLQAPDIKSAIMANMERIDETFMSVLQANVEEARRTGNIEASSRLSSIYEEIINLIQASAPPEVQLINSLLSAENDIATAELLREKRSQITPDLLEMMEKLSGDLKANGRGAVAERLDYIRAEAAKLLN